MRQQVPDVTVINEAASAWTDWLAFVVPALVALAIVVINDIYQRKAQRREFDAQERRWQAQREADQVRWAEQQAFERERFISVERRKAYSAFLACVDEMMWSGAEMGSKQLGLADKPRFGRRSWKDEESRRWEWNGIVTKFMNAGWEVLLIASDRFANVVSDLLSTEFSSLDPIRHPRAWVTPQDEEEVTVVFDALVNLRGRALEVAREELGVEQLGTLDAEEPVSSD